MKRVLPIALAFLLLGTGSLMAQTGGTWDPQEAFRQAQLLASSGKLKQGLALFLEIRERAPRYRSVAVQRNICRLYEKTGDIPQALKEYERFILDYPWARDRVQTLMRMAAMAEVALHDLDRAWKYLDMIPEKTFPRGIWPPISSTRATSWRIWAARKRPWSITRGW